MLVEGRAGSASAAQSPRLLYIIVAAVIVLHVQHEASVILSYRSCELLDVLVSEFNISESAISPI